MDINNRIAVLIKALNLTAQKFAESVNTNASNIAHITSNRSKPSYPLLNAILNRYEDVSSDWLMMGKGNVFRSENANCQKNIDAIGYGIDTKDQTDKIISFEEVVDSASVDISVGIENGNKDVPEVVNKPEEINESVVKTTPREVRKVILLYDDMSFEEFNK